VLVSGALALAPRVWAHGDVHVRINALTAEIAQNPSNAPLYFQRAELYRVDQDFTNALADLERAAIIDPKLARVDFCRGRVLLEAKRADEALPLISRYLANKPSDPEAYITRARTYQRLGNFAAAADDYAVAAEQSPTANPEIFIERAEALRHAGKLSEATAVLDSAIGKMGSLVTLELPAIDLEVRMKKFDAALARVDRMMARLHRKETWHVRRAEILAQAGRGNEATRAYRDALAAIDRLPPTHRRTRATFDLEQRIRTALAANAVPAPEKN
jgi:predicted Zn-dependent protease